MQRKHMAQWYRPLLIVIIDICQRLLFKVTNADIQLHVEKLLMKKDEWTCNAKTCYNNSLTIA